MQTACKTPGLMQTSAAMISTCSNDFTDFAVCAAMMLHSKPAIVRVCSTTQDPCCPSLSLMYTITSSLADRACKATPSIASAAASACHEMH